MMNSFFEWLRTNEAMDVTASGFIEDIVKTPSDPAPRVIFADWLDDNGDPQSAEILRRADEEIFAVEIITEYYQGPHDEYDHDWEHLDPWYEPEQESPCTWAEAVAELSSEGRRMYSETGYPIRADNAANMWYASEGDQDYDTAIVSKRMLRVKMLDETHNITNLVAWLLYRSAGMRTEN